MEDAIAACDLCVNLRHPTAGETSASLLRVLAVGRPAIVSDYAQFAELPDDAVVKVSLLEENGDGEVESLAIQLRALLEAPDRLRAMGEAARRRVREEHDPGRAAAAVVVACEEWAELSPPGDRAASLSVPSTRSWGRLEGKIAVEGGDATWRPGERRTLIVRLENRGINRWLAGRAGGGGVALQIQLCPVSEPHRDLFAGRPWLPLPRPVEPGASITVPCVVRRPPGEARLTVEAHVLGGGGRGTGGLVWEGAL
jgi:hypothetical protein